MNEAYVAFLEAKRDELEAQVSMMTKMVYYKDSVIRRLKAENELIASEYRNKGRA